MGHLFYDPRLPLGQANRIQDDLLHRHCRPGCIDGRLSLVGLDADAVKPGGDGLAHCAPRRSGNGCHRSNHNGEASHLNEAAADLSDAVFYSSPSSYEIPKRPIWMRVLSLGGQMCRLSTRLEPAM